MRRLAREGLENDNAEMMKTSESSSTKPNSDSRITEKPPFRPAKDDTKPVLQDPVISLSLYIYIGMLILLCFRDCLICLIISFLLFALFLFLLYGNRCWDLIQLRQRKLCCDCLRSRLSNQLLNHECPEHVTSFLLLPMLYPLSFYEVWTLMVIWASLKTQFLLNLIGSGMIKSISVKNLTLLWFDLKIVL